MKWKRVVIRTEWNHPLSNKRYRVFITIIETRCWPRRLIWECGFLLPEWLFLSNYASASQVPPRIQSELLDMQNLCRNLNGNQSGIFCYLIMKMLMKNSTQPSTSPVQKRLNIQHCYQWAKPFRVKSVILFRCYLYIIYSKIYKQIKIV